MARNLKALGLALVAVFAMSAVVAAGAQAGTFSAEAYPVSLHASQVEGESHVFTLTDDNNLETKCSTATFTGEASEASSTVEVHPEYSGCKAFLGVEATIVTTGCNYLFHAGETSGESVNGTTDIKCSEGSKITITSASCALAVESQNGLGNVKFTNMAGSPNDVTAKAEVTGITYKVTKDGLFCPLVNGQTGGTKGDYVGNTTVTGTSGGSSTGVSVE